MIITDSAEGWGSKVNFTDENDVFIGYDTHQDCCEDAGYFISKSPTHAFTYDDDASLLYEDESIVDGYDFDTTFFEDIESKDLDEGGQVCFKLMRDGCDDIYLHLYNSHNGYYGHGFEAKISGEIWQEGGL